MQAIPVYAHRTAALRRYGVAVLASAAALLLRMALTPLLGASAPLLIFVVPVVISGWYGGRGPGLLATALCAALGAAFLLPPITSFWVESVDDIVRVTLLVIVGVAISILTGALHEARRAAEADTQALRRSQEQLRQSQAHLAGIIDSAMDAIITADAGQHIILFNKAAEQIFGYRAEEIIGRPLDPLIPASARDAHRQHVKAFSHTGITSRSMRSPGLLRGVRRSGEEFPIEATIAHFTVDGEQYFTVILRDISERVRAERERHEFERKLQETQRLESLGVLAGGVAHDFNNLLAGVLGNAELAIEELTPGAPGAEELQQIRLLARRASELTKQLLAYSGRGHFVVAVVDLGALVDEMLRLLQSSIPRTATLRHERSPAPLTVEADATQLRQVVMNLVINGGEALGDAPGEIVVTTSRVSAAPPLDETTFSSPELAAGPYVVLTVADTGHGIEPGTLGRIFEPFFTTKFTGRGLGLAAVLGIVRGHRGLLRVESAPSAGTLFHIYLPATEHAPADELPQPAAPPPSSGRTVLVIDDEEGIRTLVARILQRDGLQVLSAEDGLVGLELFHRHADAIDGVLLDMTMPRMSGRETCQAIRAARPEVPVVLISGYSSEEVAGAFTEADPVAVLQKPFSANELRAAVASMLNGPSPTRG